MERPVGTNYIQRAHSQQSHAPVVHEEAHFAVGSAVMVDVGSRAQPELRTTLSGGEHDAKVIYSGYQKVQFFFFCQFCNDSKQIVNLFMLSPNKESI